MTTWLQLQRENARWMRGRQSLRLMCTFAWMMLACWMPPAGAQSSSSDAEGRTENGWIDLPAPVSAPSQPVPVRPIPVQTTPADTAGVSLKTADHLTAPTPAPVAVARAVPIEVPLPNNSAASAPIAVPRPVQSDALPVQAVAAQPAITSAPVTINAAVPSTLDAGPADTDPSLKLGTGDGVSVTVYGRPELSTTTYVTDKGTIDVPLAGAVAVAGATPAVASQRVAAALKDGGFLVNPQVTILITQFRSQQVSVLGDVRTPSRFPVESRTTIFDLLAQAGGVTDNGASIIFLLRPDGNGHVTRYPINLTGLADGDKSMPTITLKGGDTVFVPRAQQFYIYGEVQAPNMYRLEPSMTVVQAITRSGGLTVRGSNSRVEIIRRNAAGQNVTLYPELNDPVMANDVIRVKERIF